MVHLHVSFIGSCLTLFGYLGLKNDVFVTLVFKLLFLMFFGFESGCLGVENEAFGKRGTAKTNLRGNWNSVPRFMMLGSLRANFHDFCCHGGCPGNW